MPWFHPQGKDCEHTGKESAEGAARLVSAADPPTCHPWHIPWVAHSMGGNNHQPGSFGCKQQKLALEQESMGRCSVTLRIKGKAGGLGSGRIRLVSAMGSRDQELLGNLFRAYVLG